MLDKYIVTAGEIVNYVTNGQPDSRVKYDLARGSIDISCPRDGTLLRLTTAADIMDQDPFSATGLCVFIHPLRVAQRKITHSVSDTSTVKGIEIYGNHLKKDYFKQPGFKKIMNDYLEEQGLELKFFAPYYTDNPPMHCIQPLILTGVQRASKISSLHSGQSLR